MKNPFYSFNAAKLFHNFSHWWNQSYKFLACAVRYTHSLPTINSEKPISDKNKPRYTKPSELYKESGIEYGRNFALWKCLNCEKRWTSAYSWISTKFCLQNTKTINIKSKQGGGSEELWFDGAKLKNQDFLLEKCNDCDSKDKANKGNNVKIVRYKKLIWNNPEESEIISPHRQDLCAKCLKGDTCNDRKDIHFLEGIPPKTSSSPSGKVRSGKAQARDFSSTCFRPLPNKHNLIPNVKDKQYLIRLLSDILIPLKYNTMYKLDFFTKTKDGNIDFTDIMELEYAWSDNAIYDEDYKEKLYTGEIWNEFKGYALTHTDFMNKSLIPEFNLYLDKLCNILMNTPEYEGYIIIKINRTSLRP
jgi:hypothetical protein